MGLTRVIATLPYWTLVPEDVATNTFYFASVADPTPPDCAALASRLDAFYTAIDSFLSPVIKPAELFYKFYDMADPEPRTPIVTLEGAALALGSSGYAEEVAACLSYYAAPLSGEPASRRRGRIFIGPLADNAVDVGSTSTFSRPAAGVLTGITNAARVLADQSEPFQWAVYSPTDGVARQIIGGWMDNALDTQRRRGRPATARTTWIGQA